jgi:hypothetical protein
MRRFNYKYALDIMGATKFTKTIGWSLKPARPPLPAPAATALPATRAGGQRASLMKQMRGILLERGIVVAQGRRKLLDALEALSSEPDDGAVGPRLPLLLDNTLDQRLTLDTRIAFL